MHIHGIFKNHPKFHSVQRGKIMDPKKVEVLVNIPIPTTPQKIQVFNGSHNFTCAL
jgi:hypothetical protein